MNCTQTPLHHICPTASQFTPDVPYLESTEPDQTTDSVFIYQPSHLDSSSSQVSITTSPVPPAPRSARSTKGAPPVQFGKVYTHSTIPSKVTEPIK